ncbi:hypothetical protein CCP4SC76_390007 [Gammaproteobacteria bacterium]
MRKNAQHIDEPIIWYPNLGTVQNPGRAEIAQLRSDCLTLALRLFGEDDYTFSPESHEVMSRWRPKCFALMNGEPFPETTL